MEKTTITIELISKDDEEIDDISIKMDGAGTTCFVKLEIILLLTLVDYFKFDKTDKSVFVMGLAKFETAREFGIIEKVDVKKTPSGEIVNLADRARGAGK